jgi:gas vesicle protein
VFRWSKKCSIRRVAKDNDRFAIFLAGLGIGVIGTLLLAPLSGADARTRIKRGAGKANDYLKDGTTALVDQAGEAIDELTEETKCELDNVAAAARKAIGKVSR